MEEEQEEEKEEEEEKKLPCDILQSSPASPGEVQHCSEGKLLQLWQRAGAGAGAGAGGGCSFRSTSRIRISYQPCHTSL